MSRDPQQASRQDNRKYPRQDADQHDQGGTEREADKGRDEDDLDGQAVLSLSIMIALLRAAITDNPVTAIV